MFDTELPLYGLFILLSLLANIIVVMLLYRNFKFSRDEIIGALVYENLGIIGGAKILTYLQDSHQHDEFDFLSLGLSAYGAVIGAIICLILFGLQFKKNIKDMLFIFMPSLPLMYAIGKIACFFAGCCYGIEYAGWGHIVYNYSLAAPKGIPFFPVQLGETIFFICIFSYMIHQLMKNKFSWRTLNISGILCGVAKFSLDFLRIGHVDTLLSLNQILSIIFIIIGALFMVKTKIMSFFTIGK